MNIERVKGKTYATAAFSVLLSFFLVFVSVYSATTISTNVSTGGTLGVTGVSTLAGAVYASSTLQATGAARFYSTVTVDGTLNATSSLAVTGLSRFYNSVGVGTDTPASNLSVVGTFQTGGQAIFGGAITTATSSLGIASTSPAAEVSAVSAGTSTLYLYSSASTAGGCIELTNPKAVHYRLYVNPNGGLQTETGSCK